MINFTAQIYDKVPVTENGMLYNSQTAATLNQAQIGVLDELNIVLTDDDVSITSLQNRISTIESGISSLNLPEQDQSTLYIATNTARYSLTYWYENFDEWQQLLGTGYRLAGIPSSRVNSFSWKRVGKGDVAGVAAGAAAWGGAAIFGGPVTWAAFGISVGGWAAGCSAYEAITQLW